MAWMLLAGCGSGGGGSPDSNNHGYGYRYDIQGPGGLRLRYTPVLAANVSQFTDPAYFERVFAETEACTGLSAPPPFVIWDRLDLSRELALYYSQPSLVVLGAPGAERHEFVHYLLDVNTGDQDHDHRSPFFRECS